MTDYFFDDTETILKKNEKKKKLNELLDRYGSIENIEKNAIGVDGYDYMFANTDNLINEVLEERTLRQVSRLAKQENIINDINKKNQLNILQEHQNTEKYPYEENKYAKHEYNKKRDGNENIKKDKESKRENNLFNEEEIFNRVFFRTLNEEGGYEDKKHKIDAPTNMGIRQDTLERFKKVHPKQAINFPIHVRDLSLKQAKLIAKLDFFDKYRIKEIKNKALQETMYDAFFNHSPTAPALWAQKSINRYTSMQVKEDGVFGSETINALNNLSDKEIIAVNNSIIDMRQADHEKEKKVNKNPNYEEYTKGLPSRFDRFRIK